MNQFIFAFLGTLGFTIFFNSAKKIMFLTAVIGGLGWTINLLITNFTNSSAIGAFLGAFLVGILGEIVARLLKYPVTTFVIPGIITMVPGAGCYYTIFYITKSEYSIAAFYGIETILISISIATGIILSTYIGKMYNRIKRMDNY